MRVTLMRIMGVANVVLAAGLVVVAMFLYGREHEVRKVERQIRKLEQARKLEEDAIRLLAIEWQSLRNPMRLEALARLKLNLAPPDPLAVRTEGAALNMLPLRPSEAVEEGAVSTDRDALSALAAQASGVGAPAPETRETGDGAAGAGEAARNALNGLIRDAVAGEER